MDRLNPNSRDAQSPAVHGAKVPAIHAGTTAFWVLLKHLPNLDGLCATIFLEVRVCIHVQRFYVLKITKK